MYRRILIVFFVCTITGSTLAQTLTAERHTGVQSIPVGDDVYFLLRRLSVRGLINRYSESVLPLSEFEITQFLRQALAKDLTVSERAQIEKYLRTYTRLPYETVTVFSSENAEPFFGGGVFTDNDKYLYKWTDTASQSDLRVNFIGSLEARMRSKPQTGNAVLGVIGGRVQGTLSGHVGYYMQTTNGQSFGDSSIALEDPVIGRNSNFAIYSNHTFYDFTTAELVYNNDWFTGKLARSPLSVGGSYSLDNIIISPNVPYYEQMNLTAKIGAVRYQATLGSLLGDSRFSERPESAPGTTYGSTTYIDPKFIALHHLNIALGDDLDFGFTDITVFSRRFDLAYLNPFSFLKSVEHSLSDRDNGLLGMHLRWRILDGLELRAQGLMDDIAASRIGTGYWSNKFAWQTGLMWASPYDVDVTVEYTRIEPFMYSHFNPQDAYVTSSSLLGSSIGPNSIKYWLNLRWTTNEKFVVSLSLGYIQHGENIYDANDSLITNYGADVLQTIRGDLDATRSFHILDGRRVNTVELEVNTEYELWRGIKIFGQLYNRSVNYPDGEPLNPQRTPYGLITFGARAIL